MVKDKPLERCLESGIDYEYCATTLSRLNTFRKAGGKFCDVVLEVEGHNLPAHRAVLAAASGTFCELFDREESAQQKHFKLHAVDHDCLTLLVDYAYTARLKIPDDKVKAVYKTSRLLKMAAVLEACTKYLAQSLTPQNCLGVRSFANKYSDTELTSLTDQYIQSHLDEIIKSGQLSSKTILRFDIIDSAGVLSWSSDRQQKALCQLVIDWLQDNFDDSKLQDSVDEPLLLYLSNDNKLCDCLEMDDSSLLKVDEDDMIKDYKILGKHKQIIPVRRNSRCKSQLHQSGNEKSLVNNNGHSEHNHNGSSAVGSPSLFSKYLEEQPPPKEWTLVASKMLSNRVCLCIAVIGDQATTLSLALKNHQNGSIGGSGKSSATPSPPSSPRACGGRRCSLDELARMKSVRSGMGTAVLDGQLIVLGGYDRGECLNTTEIFDLRFNCWSQWKPMSVHRGRFGICQLEGSIYACGGSDGVNALKSAERFDSSSEQWRLLPDMLMEHSSGGSAALGGRVYVVGGSCGRSALAECEAYDPETNAWTMIADLNIGRSEAGVCTVSDRIFAVGGSDSMSALNSVECYDPQVNDWALIAPMTSHRRGVGVAEFAGMLYVVGGCDGQSSVGIVEIYDPAAGSWSVGPTLTVPRANVGLAIVGLRLFAVGGYSSKGKFLDSVEYLSQGTSEWCSYVPITANPWPQEGGAMTSSWPSAGGATSDEGQVSSSWDENYISSADELDSTSGDLSGLKILIL